VPWQPKQRAQFSQFGEQTGTTRSPFGRGRGRGGRGRGRVVARNQSWVSGGVLTAGDFIGVQAKSAYDGSQFNTDDDYSQLAESARNFAAASANAHTGYEYDSYQGYGTSGQVMGQALTQQGQKRGGGTGAGSGVFTAYGSYTTHGGTSEVQSPSQAAGRGRSRGFGTPRGGSATTSSTKPQALAVGTSATPRMKFGASPAGVGYSSTAQLMQQQQSASRPVLAAEQYATAIAPDSYTSLAGQDQHLYEAYGYECADASAAYPQAAYYTAATGQYLTTDAAVPQYYSQF